MALGPGDWDSQLLTGGAGGDIRYTDFRLLPPEDGQPPSPAAQVPPCAVLCHLCCC